MVVARVGGDEFAIITNAGSIADTRHAARRPAIDGRFKEPFIIEGQPIECGVSVGVVPIDDTVATDRSI